MSDTKQIAVIPDVQAIEKSVQPLLQRISAFVITDEETYYNAGELMNEIAKGEGIVNKEIGPTVKAAEDSFKAAKDTREKARGLLARFMDPLAAAKKLLSDRRSGWRQEVERKRIEAQDRINAENKRIADEAAEKERQRLKAIADEQERQRKEKADADLAESNRKAEELRASGKAAQAAKLAEEAAAKAKEDELAAAALRSLDELDHEEAIAAAVPEPEQITLAAPVNPKTAGVSSRRNYKFNLVDVNKLPPEYIKPREADMVKIGGVVRSQKEATSIVPTPSKLISGINVFFEEVDFTRKTGKKDE
jgi:hypothetical protein